MDLTNFDEVTRAIREENWNMGVALDNLDASVSDYVEKHRGGYWNDYMKEIVERTALYMLYFIKGNKADEGFNKAARLWKEYEAVPEENRDAKSDAYDAYKEADDKATDLNTESEEIKTHIEAQDFFDFK
jgi:hypothetical protein